MSNELSSLRKSARSGLIRMLLPLVLISSPCRSGEEAEKDNIVSTQEVKDDYYWANKGREAHAKGECDEARRCYEESLKLNPDNPYALSGMGVIILDDGDAKKAQSNLERAVTLEGADGQVFCNLGSFCDTYELNFKKAKGFYERGYALGNKVDALLYLGELYSRAYISNLNGAPEMLKSSGLNQVQVLKKSRECYQEALSLLSKDDSQKNSIVFRINQITSILEKKFPGEK